MSWTRLLHIAGPLVVLAGISAGCHAPPDASGPSDALKDGGPPDVAVDGAEDTTADGSEVSRDGSQDADTTDGADGSDAAEDTADVPADTPSPDTGPCAADASADRDGDGVLDCEEAQLCTDPLDGDSDGDGLSDLEELNRQTDPCAADTDGDGLSDYREIQAGLDPTDPTTYGDTPDGEQWLAKACRQHSPQEVNYYTSGPGNWTVALPKSMSNYRTLPTPGYTAPPAVGIYGDPLRTIAGMVLAVRAPDGDAHPTDALDGPLRQAVDAKGDITLNYLGGTYRTHDGKLAANFDLEVTTDQPTTAKKLRQDIIYAVSTTLEPGDVQNLPSTVGPEYTKFRIEATALRRRPASRPAHVLYSINLVPTSLYRSRPQVERAIDDLSNGSHLADASAAPLPSCHRQELTTQSSKVDFYWMLSWKGNISEEVNIIEEFADKFTSALQQSRIDHRFGVSQTCPLDDGLMELPPGWHKRASTLKTSLERAYMCKGFGDPSSRWRCETPNMAQKQYPIQNAWEGISHMKGFRGAAPTPDETLRSDAELFTIIISDEPADGPKRAQAIQTLSEWSTVFSYIPYTTTEVDSIQYGDCSGGFYGPDHLDPYKKLAADSGGAFVDICLFPDGQEMLDRIFETALAETSAYTLPKRPISSTLKVYMNGQWVPRSEDDGYTYSSGSNSLVFHGRYRPSRNIAEEGPPSLIAVHYESYLAGCKTTGDIDTCPRP